MKFTTRIQSCLSWLLSDSKSRCNICYVMFYSMCSLVVSTLNSPVVDARSNPGSGSALWWVKISGCILHLQLSYANRQSALHAVTNQMVTGSRLTGYIVNVMRSPVIERLLVRGSQVALKHVFHDMEIRTRVMELRRRAIKRWLPCWDMDRRLKIPHSAKVECGFWTTPEEYLYDSGLNGLHV